MKRLWGKRFEKALSPLAEVFTSGRDVREIAPADERLVPYDLWGSRAHVVMLARQGILPRREARILIKGLREIEESRKKGKFQLDPAKEDVHSNVESYLIAKYGIEVGGRLHTARSRNDQVVLDMRLYLRDCALDFISSHSSLLRTLLGQAGKHRDTVIPGYSHHQPAQVTTLGHIWLSFAEAFSRDIQRLQDWYQRFNQNPLGSMTGYGTSFPIDRRLTSRLLGCDEPCHNSLDPIQNRWEPEAELGFAIVAMMNHASSLAQTLILFTTEEFGLFKLDDAYSTGSSMMPQKRNPDTLEVIKAKAGVAQGLLSSLLSIGKSLFLGYNRDTQWTKYLILDLVDECLAAPQILAEILNSLEANIEKMISRCRKSFISAPDLLERIVQEGNMSFRRAKAALEQAVKYSEAEGVKHISTNALRRALKEEGLKEEIDEQIIAHAQEPQETVSRRKGVGGTSPQALEGNILSLNRSLALSKAWVTKKKKQKSAALRRLAKMERGLQ
jgi:argininosuccinate lyase